MDCHEYRYDVTALVTGNGLYSYSVTGTSNAYGDALVVVYEHGSLPPAQIIINDGAEDLASATSTTSFNAATGGAGRVIIFTEADDTFSGGESVAFNGSTVAGPADIFNANQGSFASLVTIPVTTVSGNNTMAVTSGGDEFGLHLGILVSAGNGNAGAQAPALSPAGLLAATLLLSVLGAFRVRRRLMR